MYDGDDADYANFLQTLHCMVCGGDDNEEHLLICDGEQGGGHLGLERAQGGGRRGPVVVVRV